MSSDLLTVMASETVVLFQFVFMNLNEYGRGDFVPQDAGDYVCQISILGEALEVAHTVEVMGKLCFILKVITPINSRLPSLSS